VAEIKETKSIFVITFRRLNLLRLCLESPRKASGVEDLALLSVQLTSIVWTGFPGNDQLMTKHYPQEFRDDVVKVARLSQISMRQVALDFGISAATLYKWL
jgi:hypothetical protein